VNLILFETGEISSALPRTDPRAIHLLDVLRRKVGDTFDAGLVDGPLGKGTLVSVATDSLSLAFNGGPPPPAPDPITLLIGLPRPQTARDILRDATTLGVAAIHFVTTERSDANYAASTLWTSGRMAPPLPRRRRPGFCHPSSHGHLGSLAFRERSHRSKPLQK